MSVGTITAFPEAPIIGARYDVEVWRALADNTMIERLDGASGGSVHLDPDRAISGDCTFTFERPTTLTSMKDCFAPFVTVEPYDGRPPVRYQVGLYRAMPHGLEYLTTPVGCRAVGDVNGEDTTSFLASSAMSTPLNVLAGVNIVQAMRLVIEGATFPGGVTLRHSIPDHPATMAESMTYFPGTTRLDIVNDLASRISYYTVWSDREGRITSGPYVRWDEIAPSTVYAPGDDSAMIANPTTEPATDPYNVVIVIKEHDDPAQRLVAIRRNDDPDHSYSTVTFGYEITRVVRDNQLVDQAAADALADRLLLESLAPLAHGRLATSLEPWHDVHELYEIQVPPPFAQPGCDSALLRGRWRCTGIKHDFARFQTVHDLARTTEVRVTLDGVTS